MKDDAIDINDPSVVPVKHWHWLEDGRIQCDICPRFCKLKPGQRGLCYVRARVDDAMYLTSYGRSSGFCIDPIEKKPLNHFLPGTPVLSFGTAGCNLACKFCQNWDMSKARDMDVLMNYAMPEQLAKACDELECRSIAFTYNDPVIFKEYAEDVAKACHAVGVKTVAVTAGYMCPTPRAEFYQHIDAANIDLKAFTEAFYWKVTGSHLKEVLETLVYLKHETNVWFELTNLVIPGENDSEKEFEEMTTWIASELGPDVPLHFTAFHPDYKMQKHPRTPIETLLRARDIGHKNGLHYVYTGNVHDEASGSTYCSKCEAKLIGRDWHMLSTWHLSKRGYCLSCGTPCHGVFEKEPGTWGRKRVPVKFQSD